MSTVPAGACAALVIAFGLLAHPSDAKPMAQPSAAAHHAAAHHTMKARAHHRMRRASSAAPAVPDSFLRTQAITVTELARAVQTDAAARARYARFYNLPAREVAGYFKSNLIPGKLNKTATYTVSLVRPSGTVYPTKLVLSEGTQVFTHKNGQPALLAGSGNPIMLYAPAIEVEKVIKYETRYKPGPEQIKEVPTTSNDIDMPVQTSTPVYNPTPTEEKK
jgi:hypothetical protein